MRSLRTLLALQFVLIPLSPGVSHAKTQEQPAKRENWYTVTLLPATPYAYYRESVETHNGRIHFKTQMWKKEEGFINEEQLGSFALDNEILSPLFYNFHSTYRSNELTIDGTATENRLTVRIKKLSESQAEKPVITRAIPRNTIFSSFFSIYIARQLKKQASQGSFLAILEDNEAAGFAPSNGSFKVLAQDEFSKKSGTTAVQVQFAGSKSLWYFDKQGIVARIDMPAQKSRIDRATEDQAKSFFDKPSQPKDSR